MLLCVIISRLRRIFFILYDRRLNYTVKSELATVFHKYYGDDHYGELVYDIDNVPEGKPSFRVLIDYEGKNYCIDNYDIYNTTSVGDSVAIFVHTGYDKKGKARRQFLTIK